mmetsp:Transcript_27967/g.76898  ORF Transcript_27967/g.76898 Transcript_27967/m.76898 type:complete len:284 (-) Transcript_27967:119-970(-)
MVYNEGQAWGGSSIVPSAPRCQPPGKPLHSHGQVADASDNEPKALQALLGSVGDPHKLRVYLQLCRCVLQTVRKLGHSHLHDLPVGAEAVGRVLQGFPVPGDCCKHHLRVSPKGFRGVLKRVRGLTNRRQHHLWVRLGLRSSKLQSVTVLRNCYFQNVSVAFQSFSCMCKCISVLRDGNLHKVSVAFEVGGCILQGAPPVGHCRLHRLQIALKLCRSICKLPTVLGNRLKLLLPAASHRSHACPTCARRATRRPASAERRSAQAGGGRDAKAQRSCKQPLATW